MATYNKQIKYIANHYGLEKQLVKSLEELEELKAEIKSYIQYPDDYLLYRLADEMADAEIMISQLKMLLNLSDAVEEVKENKIARQLGRIEAEKSATNQFV